MNHQQKPDDRLTVIDFAGSDHFNGSRQRNLTDLEMTLLGAIGFALDGHQAAAEKHGDHFVGHPRCGSERHKFLQRGSHQTDLFAKFPGGSVKACFARLVEQSGRNLPDRSAQRRSELSDHRDRAVIVKRHHCDRARISNDLAFEFLAVRRPKSLRENREYRSVVRRNRLQSFEGWVVNRFEDRTQEEA